MHNIRDREIAAVSKMLNLSSSSTTLSTNFSDQWKVLIYDEDCRDIISPLMNVGALRQKGVTLHMLLHTEREQVADAPAVYFVRPSEKNIKRIVEDCEKQLYRTFYLNFVTRIDRPLMETLAKDLANLNCVSLISKVYDQYLDVIALEPSLFTLNIHNSFVAYNEPSLNELQIRSYMNRVSYGLLSLVRVLGALPIIRSPAGGAAEMLAEDLFALLKENISARGPAQALFEECLMMNDNRSRPLLLIFDRSSDLFPVLQHCSTYQALISDLLDCRLNRVTIQETTDKEAITTATKKKTYDLNTQQDAFFRNYAGAPFPEAIEANEKELAEVSQREAAIRRRPETVAVQKVTPNDNTSLEMKGKDLSEAIESLPEILNKKLNLEAHTNILHAVMKKIAAREIPTYFEMEQSLLTSGRVADRTAYMNLLKDGSKGTIQDKVRLLGLSAVTGESGVTKAVLEGFDEAFVEGCKAIPAPNTPTQEEINQSLSAIAFLRRHQSLQSGMTQRFGASKSFAMSSFFSSAQSHATSIMAKAASFFTKFTPYYVTRVVDNLGEGRQCTEDEQFTYYDPRVTGNIIGSGNVNGAGSCTKYSEVIVFVIGGGCYAEYYNLQELLRDKSAGGSSSSHLRHIMYGCTDMISGDDFIGQLKTLSSAGVASNSSTGTKT